MVNIEGELKKYLDGAGGANASVSVPKNPPKAFITVERTGGGDQSTVVSENPTVVIDCYGATRAEAFEIAAEVDRRIKRAPFVLDGVSAVAPNSVLVHYPDIVLGLERYESTYSLTTYDYEGV